MTTLEKGKGGGSSLSKGLIKWNHQNRKGLWSEKGNRKKWTKTAVTVDLPHRIKGKKLCAVSALSQRIHMTLRKDPRMWNKRGNGRSGLRQFCQGISDLKDPVKKRGGEDWNMKRGKTGRGAKKRGFSNLATSDLRAQTVFLVGKKKKNKHCLIRGKKRKRRT